MQSQESRAAQLNADIDEKLLFLARVAARDEGQSFVEFIEDAFRLALKTEAGLRFESFWDHDPRVRLFNVGRADRKLLAPKQRAIYDHVVHSLIKEGKKVTRKSFVEFIKMDEGDA
jgi:hypothetical protein